MQENIRMIAWEDATLCPSDYTHPFAHLHESSEVLYVQEGEIEVTFPEKTYRAAGGNLLFFAPLEVHRIRILRAPYRRFGLRVSRESLLCAVREPALCSIYTARPADFSHLLCLPAAHPEVPALFREIVNLYREKKPYYLDAMEAVLSLFTVLLNRACPNAFPLVSPAIRDVVYEARGYLDDHFMESISIEALSRMFFMSHSYFTHAFHALTGSTPKQYLNLRRLAHARVLLGTTHQSMEEIAAQIRFSDSNAFIRAFKKELGITPGVYRRLVGSSRAPAPDKAAYVRRIGTKPAEL